MRYLAALALSLAICSPVSAGASRSFDGADDEINFGTPFASSSVRSVLVWVKLNAITADYSLFSSTFATANDGMLLFFDDSEAGTGRTDLFRVHVNETGGSNDSASVIGATGSGQQDVWQWVAFTFDGGSSTGLRLYIDGVEDANSPASLSAIPFTGDTGNNVFVGEEVGTGRDLNGFLAYLQAWGRVLTLEELKQAALFPGSITESLSLYAPMFGSDSPEIDLSGNGNTGTVSGATASSDGPPVTIGAPPQ